MSTDAISDRKGRLRPPLRLARLAATALYLSVSVVAAQRTVILNAADETYKVTFDDTRVSETRVREWVLLSPYAVLPFSNAFDMAGSRSAGENGTEKVDKIFVAPSLEQCSAPGCGDLARVATNAWMANAAKNLDRGRQQVGRLAAMQLPEELEPVRAYLAGWLRFTLSLQETRLAYIKTGNQRPMQESMFANCGSSQIGDARMFSELTAAPVSARVDASNRWYARMIGCYGEKGSYPVAAWNSFLAKYGLHEETIFNDPDSK